MALIYFLLKTRLQNFIRENSWLELFWVFLGLIVFGSQAAAFGYFLDHPVEDVEEITAPRLLNGLFIFLTAFTLIRGFMPYFKAKTDFFSSVYPLSPAIRYFAGLAIELFSAYFLIGFFLLLIIFGVSDVFGLDYLAASVFLLTGAHFIRRILQIYLGRKVNKDGYLILSAILFIAGVLGILYSVTKFAESPQNVFQLALVTCLILLAADFVTEVKCMRFENLKEGSGKTYCSNALFVLLFQNKKLRMLFLASIIFKGLIFLFDYNNGFGMMDKGEYFYNNPYIGMEIFSCHMFVSGIFINTWGHFNNLWLTAERTGASQWQLVKIMASLMAIPVLTDALITLAIILLLKEDLFFYAVYYISVLAIGFPVAIISSIYKPVKVTKKLRSGKNSSVLFMVIMIIAPMLMLLPKKISWMYISYPIIFLIAIICAFAVLKEYNKLRYNLYAVLYKVKE